MHFNALAWCPTHPTTAPLFQLAYSSTVKLGDFGQASIANTYVGYAAIAMEQECEILFIHSADPDQSDAYYPPHKFIVDDQWRTADELPTAVDDNGSLANYEAVPILALTPPHRHLCPHPQLTTKFPTIVLV
jgi:hypothetical protein